MQNLSHYRSEVLRLGTPAFLRSYGEPVLLHRSASTIGQGAGGFRSQTQVDAQPRIPAPGTYVTVVLPLKKRPGGVYPDRVSVGRTGSCDIVLPYQQISKYHAYFTWAEDRSCYYVTDIGTTNGTSVDSLRIATQVPAVVVDGTQISFGPYAFSFYTADGFLTFLHSKPSET